MPFRLQTEPAAPANAALSGERELTATPRTNYRPRLDGIDFLRGLVMAIMVLDHARDYLGAGSMDPRDVDDPVLFLTRWITHFCAPIFVMLAGVSAYLYGGRGRTTAELQKFLFTRGVWLVLIELTVVRFAFTFNLDYDFIFLQVIWAIGCALIALAGLVRLPHRVVAAFGLAMILGHNLLDGIDPQSLGDWRWIATLLHEPDTLRPAPGVQVLALYSPIPWIGVLAVGYGLGPLLLWNPPLRRRTDPPRRPRTLLKIGIAVIVGFMVLRAANGYGDPRPWSEQSNPLATLLSFINCEKYPPSLAYLAMTLGPGLIVLALFREARGRLSRALVVFGRVPFLFYVAHLFIVHALAVLVAQWYFGESGWLFEGMPVFAKPAQYGLSLPAIYGFWMLTLALLYPLCRWFAALKQRRKDWWLSYL